jgi:[phosphatase 2A protein]-leucine-carboxy methyltransferase
VCGPALAAIIVAAHVEPPSISSLEMLDEVEELDLVLGHYAVTWGLKLPRGQQLNSLAKWIEWGLKTPPQGDQLDSDSD